MVLRQMKFSRSRSTPRIKNKIPGFVPLNEILAYHIVLHLIFPYSQYVKDHSTVSFKISLFLFCLEHLAIFNYFNVYWVHTVMLENDSCNDA